MTIGCNIWIIFFEIKLIFYGLSRMLQFSEFVWALSYSVWDVFNKFLLIDATDRSKISGDQERFFIALSLYPISFFANTPFKFTAISLKPLFAVSQQYLLNLYCRFTTGPLSLCSILNDKNFFNQLFVYNNIHEFYYSQLV